MSYRFAAADMDGTLLDSRSQLSEANIREIRHIIENGYIFTLSTGRPVQGVEKYIDILGIDAPVITYNGGMIVQSRTHEILFQQELEPEDAGGIWEEGIRRGTAMCIWSANRLYGNILDERIHTYKKLSGVEPILVNDISTLLSQGITKILWYDTPENIQKWQSELSSTPARFESVTYCTSKSYFLEFFNRKTSKALALERIGNLLGIDRSEMIAIGDGLNDLPMIQYAGLGIAMENAEPEIKEAAGYITASNDENGVARALLKFFPDKPGQ